MSVVRLILGYKYFPYLKYMNENERKANEMELTS